MSFFCGGGCNGQETGKLERKLGGKDRELASIHDRGQTNSRNNRILQKAFPARSEIRSHRIGANPEKSDFAEQLVHLVHLVHLVLAIMP